MFHQSNQLPSCSWSAYNQSTEVLWQLVKQNKDVLLWAKAAASWPSSHPFACFLSFSACQSQKVIDHVLACMLSFVAQSILAA
jgi:hypothetical protein